MRGTGGRPLPSRMRILHFTHSPPEHIPPPPLSEDQVVAGPMTPDAEVDGQVRGIRTEPGTFDASEVAARLGGRWRPDLVVVRVDAFGGCRPRNLGAFPCPAVLVVGDTHHAPEPEALAGNPEWADDRFMLRYALSHPFAAVCLDYTRQHAHFLIEAGAPRVHWLPGFNVARMPARAEGSWRYPFSLVGQVGPYHPRRTAVARSLVDAGLPLSKGEAPRDETRRIHASSQLNLNCSLNGDLNLRVLEVMQTGAALLTDRLAPEAGLDVLFEPGTHFESYRDPSEAVAVARALLADPARCRSIGAAGRAHYEATVSPEVMGRHLLALARGERIPELFDARQDGRTRLLDGTETLESVRPRVDAYALVQRLHLLNERLTLLATPAVDARMLADLVDLPRLELHRYAAPGWAGADALHARTDAMLARAGLSGRIAAPSTSAAPPPDLLLAAAADAESGAIRPLLDRHPDAKAVFLGGIDAATATALKVEPVPRLAGLWQRTARTAVRTFKRR